MPSIKPTSGDVSGGTEVYIYGAITPLDQYSDSFAGTLLDPAKWINLSPLPEYADVENGLYLSTYNGLFTRVASVATYKNFDVLINFNNSKFYDDLNPIYSNEPHRVTLYVNASNQIVISDEWSPSLQQRRFVVTYVNSGTTSIVRSEAIGVGTSYRIKRFGGSVYISSGSSSVVTIHGWTDAPLQFMLGAYSGSATDILTSTYYNFNVFPLVTFGTELAEVTRVSDTYYLVSAPASDIVGSVDVKVHTPTTSTLITSDWSYELNTKLTVGDARVLYIDTDSVLRD